MTQTPSNPPGVRVTAKGLVAHLRGLLVALHLLAITLMALPAPGEGMARDAWSDPTAQAEFAVWRERLRWLGIDLTADEFEATLWSVASSHMTLRERLLLPFQPYYTYCGTVQSWRMFAGPHRFPAQLQVEMYQDRAWFPVYVQRHSEYLWLAGTLDQYRFRPALYRFGWNQGFRDYDRFTEWVAIQARRDFPEAERVRVRFWKSRTLAPEEVRQLRKSSGAFDPRLDREVQLREAGLPQQVNFGQRPIPAPQQPKLQQ